MSHYSILLTELQCNTLFNKRKHIQNFSGVLKKQSHKSFQQLDFASSEAVLLDTVFIIATKDMEKIMYLLNEFIINQETRKKRLLLCVTLCIKLYLVE